MSQLMEFPQLRVLEHSRVKKSDGGFLGWGGNGGYLQMFSWCFFKNFKIYFQQECVNIKVQYFYCLF